MLTGIPFCIAGVVLVARPPFLFGGAGIPPLGVAVALAQCTFSALVKLLVRELRTTEQTNVRGASPLQLQQSVTWDSKCRAGMHVCCADQMSVAA